MHSAGTTIKALAYALAAIIICGIISSLVFAGWVVGNLMGIWQSVDDTIKDDNPGEIVEIEVDRDEKQEAEITELEVGVKFAWLKIVPSDELKIETNNDKITTRRDGRALSLKEEDYGIFAGQASTELTIFWPRDVELDSLKVNGGAGRTSVSGITVKRAEFDLGAGRTTLRDLEVTEQAKISGGAGLTEIFQSEFHNLDFDLGAGKAHVEATLIGTTKIDAGVGLLELKLFGQSDTYALHVDRGLGSVTINGEKRGEDEVRYGGGTNLIDIDGGVGAIVIDFLNEER